MRIKPSKFNLSHFLNLHEDGWALYADYSLKFVDENHAACHNKSMDFNKGSLITLRQGRMNAGKFRRLSCEFAS